MDALRQCVAYLFASAATDMIATDLQRQDIYDAIESNENSFYYIFGAVTCPVVAIVLVTGLFISIVLGVISHILLAYCKQSLMKWLTKKEGITIATIPPPSTPPPTTAAIYHRRRDAASAEVVAAEELRHLTRTWGDLLV